MEIGSTIKLLHTTALIKDITGEHKVTYIGDGYVTIDYKGLGVNVSMLNVELIK